MTRAFWNELPAIIRDINDNARARCIVISSTGKHFCAGMDLSVFTDGEGVTGGEPADRFVAGESFAITCTTCRTPSAASTRPACR